MANKFVFKLLNAAVIGNNESLKHNWWLLCSWIFFEQIAFAFKLAFAIWWIVATVQEGVRWTNRPTQDEMDNLHGLGQFVWYCGSIGLTVWALLRLVANFCQYRNEKVGRACCCCCSTACWFVLAVLHLIYSFGLSSTDGLCTLTNEKYPACEWPNKVAIGFLFWETFVFGFMALYKINNF